MSARATRSKLAGRDFDQKMPLIEACTVMLAKWGVWKRVELTRTLCE